MNRLDRWVTDLLMLLLPFSVFWPLGEAAVDGVLPRYVTRGFYLSDIALGLLLVASFINPSFRRLGPRAIFFPLLGVVLLAFLSIAFALAPPFSFYTAVRWSLVLLVYLWLVQSRVDAPRAIQVFVLGLCMHVLIGLLQVLRQAPLGLPGELALPAALSGAAVIPVGSLRWLRAYGLTFHPNVLGGFAAFALVAMIPLLRRFRWIAVWWFLCLGLFLSFSRASWAGAIVGVMIVFGWLLLRRPLWRPKLMWAAIGAALLLSICAIFWQPQLRTRIQPLLRLLPATAAQEFAEPIPSLEARSIDERGELIRVGLDFASRRPLTGIGAGGFPIAIVEEEIPVQPQYAHLVPLTLAAEIGLPAALLWLWLWFAGGWLLVTQWRGQEVWGVALLAGWLAIGLLGLADSYPWSLNAGRLLTATALGLAGNRVANYRESLIATRREIAQVSIGGSG